MKLNNLHDLFVYQVRQLWDSQNQLADFWPTLANAATDDQLRRSFQRQADVTNDELDRIRQICDDANISPEGVNCEATEGLIEMAYRIIEADGDPSARDAGLICSAQLIEHFEIASFGCAKAFARQLGMEDVAASLNECGRESGDIDKRLTNLAERSINVQASRK